MLFFSEYQSLLNRGYGDFDNCIHKEEFIFLFDYLIWSTCTVCTCNMYIGCQIVWEIKNVVVLLFRRFMLLKTFFNYVNPSPKKAPCAVYCSLWACCPIFIYYYEREH